MQLLASDDPVDLERANVDLAIRYGAGPYPGFDVTPMFADRFAPLANPMLKVEGAGDLAQEPLIDFLWHHKRPENPTWARWFAAAGLPEPHEPPVLRFSEESHAIQAAVAGQGVALVSLALVRDELAARQLVRLPGPSITGFRHHILTRKGEPTNAVMKVAHWLMTEADLID